MVSLDNIVAIIKPTKEFYNWLSQSSINDACLSYEDHCKDCIGIIIPNLENYIEIEQYIMEMYSLIFKEELETRVTKQYWPKDLTYELFKKWFAIEIHSKIYLTYKLYDMHSTRH